MKRLQWLKVPIGIFHHPKVQHLLLQPNGDAYVIIWLMLKDLAGQIDDGGAIYLSKQEPITVEMLAKQFGKRKQVLGKALELLEKLELISRDDRGFITILTWDEDQSRDKLDRMRERTRIRTAQYRERKREMAEQSEPTADSTPVKAQVKRDGPCTKHYEQAFGGVSPQIAMKLGEFEEDWGTEAVCRSIDIAKYKGIYNIEYILGILRHGGGKEDKKVNYDWDKDLDKDIDELLRKATELEYDTGKGADDPESVAGKPDGSTC